MDFFHIEKGDKLAFVDRCSAYKKMFNMKKMSSDHLIEVLESWFQTVGYPQRIRSDGGPAFRDRYIKWTKSRGIIAEITSPYSSSSNGLAENGVRELKRLWYKCQDDKSDFQESIFIYNNTKRPTGRSPAEIFFRRTLYQGLPSLTLKDTPDYEKMQNEREMSQTKSRGRRDKLGGNETFQEGDLVILQDQDINSPTEGKWVIEAEILRPRIPVGAKHDYVPRSYLVRTNNGKKYLRSRRFIRHRPREPREPREPGLDAESGLPADGEQREKQAIGQEEREGPRRSDRIGQKQAQTARLDRGTAKRARKTVTFATKDKVVVFDQWSRLSNG